MKKIIQKIDYLNLHGLNKHVIERREVKNNCFIMKFSDDLLSGNNQKYNRVPLDDQIKIVFSILDIYIDYLFSNKYIGENFTKRFNVLPENNDREIIFKLTYGLIRKLRNTVDHRNNNIIVNENDIDFDGILITKEALYLMYSLVCEYFSNDINKYYCKYYHLGILRSYYDKILNELKINNSQAYNDYSSITVSNEIRINVKRVRNVILTTKYTVNNDYINIETYNSEKYSEYGTDYRLNYNNSIFYIPIEALDINGNIYISNINNWILENDLQN